MKAIRVLKIVTILYFASVPIQGQSIFQKDTLRIQDVVITAKQITSEQPGFKFYTIDSIGLKDYSLYSLTEVLTETTPLFIKNYGSGGTATSSFRGTSAGHTQVNWNGININDPMLGQADFSLIPAGMVDNVLISFGGGSMDLGNGGIGGLINLANEPSWTKHTLIDLAPGAGSFGRFAGFVKFKTGNDHFQSVTKLYGNSSLNNFSYLNSEAIPDSEPKKRENNQTQQNGILQELYFRKSKNVLSARLWYHSSNRELPGSTLYGYAGEEQSDKAFRGLIDYNFFKKQNEYFLTAALISTDLNYISELYSIDSRNKVNSIVLKGGLTKPLGDYTRLKIIVNEEFSKVTSNNYLEQITRYNTSLTVSAERKKGRRFGAVILLREVLVDDSFYIPDFSAGIEYRVLPGEEHYLKLNTSRNSKIPSLNDRYWNPGGNPDLKNEYAYSYEIGYKMNQKISSSLNISAETNYFNNYIRDLIQWRQGEFSYWVADNINRVNTSGLESSVHLAYSANNLSMRFNTGYSYVRALSKDPASSGKQLNYVPKNQANSSLRLDYNNFYSVWLTDFTGRSYITDDNTEYLKGYLLNNIIGGIKFGFEKGILDFCLRVENLFNVRYETIAYFPQPGRSFFITLTYRLKN